MQDLSSVKKKKKKLKNQTVIKIPATAKTKIPHASGRRAVYERVARKAKLTCNITPALSIR